MFSVVKDALASRASRTVRPRRLRKKIAQWNKRKTARYDVLGHFHQIIDAWDYIACGCLCGYDAYALEIGAEYQPPTQTFAVIDREYGKVLTVPIFVEESA
jgi:hypothetical protein